MARWRAAGAPDLAGERLGHSPQAPGIAGAATTSAGVAACIRSLIQRWSFPVKPDEDAPVSFPFVFQPGG